MKTLVTGSSGFIGRWVCSRLLAGGHDVAGLDKTPPRDDSNNAVSYLCDILDGPRLSAIMREYQPEAVIHLAARTDLNEKHDIGGYAANIDGARNVIDAVCRTPSIRRAIYTSSQLVCKVGHVPREMDEYCPNTLYGQSKVLTERIVKDADGGGVEWCLVRPTTVWGPHMSEHYQRFLGYIQTGRYFHVTRRPLFKSYSYVGNIVVQYRKLLEASTQKIHRKVFYLADYDALSLRSWANEFQRELNAPPIKTVPEGLAKLAANIGDMVNLLGYRNFAFNSFRLKNVLTEYVFDLRETEEVCGPLPYSMEEGVRDTVKWFKHEPVGSMSAETSE